MKVKMPQKPFLDHMTKEQLRALLDHIFMYSGVRFTDREIAGIVWDYEAARNLEKGKEILSKRTAHMTSDEFMKSVEAFSRQQDDAHVIQEFYDREVMLRKSEVE